MQASVGFPDNKENLNDQNHQKKKMSVIQKLQQPQPSQFEEELVHLQHTTGMTSRPPLPQLSPQTDTISFQQIELDEGVCAPLPALNYGYDVSLMLSVPIIRLYGCTDKGNSVYLAVHGFFPYFYVPCPSQLSASDIESFRQFLNKEVEPNQLAVLKVELVKRQTIYGYFGNEQKNFLKITVALHKYISKAKTLLESGQLKWHGVPMTLAPYETNLAYSMRFMIDCKVSGCNWIELPKGKWLQSNRNESYCQLEADILYSDLISHPAEGDWSKIAPLRILSFDIECAGRKGVFPDPKLDPVIQIANMVTLQGEQKPFIRNIFTLKECAHIVGSQIHSYESEAELLSNWSQFIREVDPDIVTGYNINNFDWPYLLDRAEVLKVSDFAAFGRLRANRTLAKDTRFSSRAYGTRENKEINLDGRIQLDLLQVIQRDYKLRSYTLNSVSAHFLGEQKEDVPHQIISDLQNGDPQTRRRLAVYCLKDAYLPQRLLDKLMIVINYMEMARVTGVPFNYLLTRGQQIKVISQLYRKALDEQMVIPALKQEGTEDQYEGATVIEPKKAYYKDPISTLDFSSLYPSIMMAHNLCYSTLLLQPDFVQQLGLVKDKDYIQTPSNDLFVKSTVKKGILPMILESLISARKKAKQDLKKETDPFKRAVLDGRQLALKISANSVYGFTGATVGKLPCLPVSQSVTAFGRQMIEFTKQCVEEHFTMRNGYEHDAEVVYGDTDSVMVRFGCQDLETAMRLGREAAEFITAKFVKPINLEFEKVYWPYLLINKKRYAGLYWTRLEAPDKMDTKGIETVRRDNCRLVQTVIDTCLRKILMDKDAQGAVQFAKETISLLLQNKIDLSQLVITKQLSKSQEDYAAKQAHVELAERMKKRDAGSAPSMGDRVAYVIVKAAKGAPAFERAEDPIWVLENNIPIDTKYYLDNQLKNPLLRIFEPILQNAEQQLLSGDHTRTIQISARKGGLMKFAVKKKTCLGCKAILRPEEQDVCQHCQPNYAQIYLKNLNTLVSNEKKFHQLWTQCQRCQGSLLQDVLCTSRDCPIFYMRKKVGMLCLEEEAKLPKSIEF